MKKWKLINLFGVILLLLCGCGKAQLQPPAVVTRVDIDCRHAGIRIFRSYTETEQIEAVLDYLRLQRTLGRAETDPERIRGDSYVIEIHSSNGQRHIYRLRADRYLSKDNHPWQRIDPEYSGGLYALLWDVR